MTSPHPYIVIQTLMIFVVNSARVRQMLAVFSVSITVADIQEEHRKWREAGHAAGHVLWVL